VAGAIAVEVGSLLAIPHPVVMPWAGQEAMAAIAARAPTQVAALGLGPAMGIIAISGTAITA